MSRAMDKEGPRIPHLARGNEVGDLRDDVDDAFDRVEAEFDDHEDHSLEVRPTDPFWLDAPPGDPNAAYEKDGDNEFGPQATNVNRAYAVSDGPVAPSTLEGTAATRGLENGALLEEEWVMWWSPPNMLDMKRFFASSASSTGFQIAFDSGAAWAFAHDATNGLVATVPDAATVQDFVTEFNAWASTPDVATGHPGLTGLPTDLMSFVGTSGVETILAALGGVAPGGLDPATHVFELANDYAAESFDLKIQGLDGVHTLSGFSKVDGSEDIARLRFAVLANGPLNLEPSVVIDMETADGESVGGLEDVVYVIVTIEDLVGTLAYTGTILSQGYWTGRLDDDSVIVKNIRMTEVLDFANPGGVAAPATPGQALAAQWGTAEIHGGTGRFENATGTANFFGRALADVVPAELLGAPPGGIFLNLITGQLEHQSSLWIFDLTGPADEILA